MRVVVLLLMLATAAVGELRKGDVGVCVDTLNHPVEQRMTRKCHPASKKSICYTTNTVVIKKEEVVCCIDYYYNGTSCVLDCPYGFLPTPNNSACYPECIPGYSTNYSDPALNCVTDCKLYCINGTCSDTNECICHDGYKKNGLYECTPHCDNCDDGVCKSPGECVCNKGYKREDNTCKPVCDHCEHGTCVKPNICDCVLGYINDGGMSRCKPLCMECNNGTCVSPHVCECDPGFESDPDKRRCHPVCENGCANATCVAPNTCECVEGFAKSGASGGCQPVCGRCSGECVEPGVCVPSCEECGGACRKNEYCMCPNGTMCIDMRLKMARMKALLGTNCNDCAGTCTDGICKCANGTRCEDFQREAAGSNLTIAGIHVTWMLGGGILILLLILIGVVSRQIYLKHTYNQKNQGHDKDTAYGSVVYTVPNTLKAPESIPYQDDYEEADVPDPTEMGLLSNKDYVGRL